MAAFLGTICRGNTPFIYSFNQYWLSLDYVLGNILGTEETVVIKTGKDLGLQRTYLLVQGDTPQTRLIGKYMVR